MVVLANLWEAAIYGQVEIIPGGGDSRGEARGGLILQQGQGGGDASRQMVEESTELKVEEIVRVFLVDTGMVVDVSTFEIGVKYIS